MCRCERKWSDFSHPYENFHTWKSRLYMWITKIHMSLCLYSHGEFASSWVNSTFSHFSLHTINYFHMWIKILTGKKKTMSHVNLIFFNQLSAFLKMWVKTSRCENVNFTCELHKFICDWLIFKWELDRPYLNKTWGMKLHVSSTFSQIHKLSFM